MRDDRCPMHDASTTMDAPLYAERPALGQRLPLAALARRVALLACAGLMIAGCSATGQPHGKLANGLRMPFGWTSSKSEEEAFRKAVKNDSFPTAAEAGAQ